jgi:DNA-binding HxlR family transcriptional regulator
VWHIFNLGDKLKYREAILEALGDYIAGMTFKELLEYMHRHVNQHVDEASLKKILSRELQRLESDKLVVRTFLPTPDGEIIRLYTSVENLNKKYTLTHEEVSWLLYEKYLRCQKRDNKNR